MKRYLITGASRGIGRAIAEKLAGRDVELLLHGRDTVALAQTRKTVEPKCAKVTMLIYDLATARGVSDLIAEVGRKPIELLVNNAGIAVVKPFTEITSGRMGANYRREYHRAIPVNTALCATAPAGF
jgi:short-subunit dehydrogenase